MNTFESVFNDVGKQLKRCAVILFAIGVILGIIVGIGLLYAEFTLENLLLGALVVISIFLGAWCSTVLLYAFGELVDKVSTISAQVADLSYQVTQPEESEDQ